MEFDKFKSTLDSIRKIDEYIDKAYDLGIDIINMPVNDEMWNAYKQLFTTIYTDEGWEWITWYLYEMPHFEDLIKENGPKKEYYAWDAEGNPMDLSTDDKLWEMLENDYNTK